MEEQDQIVALLKRMEENQLKSLQAQEQHLAFAKAQLEKSESRIKENVELQRLGIARQVQMHNVALPLILVLLLLLGYLLFKWRVIL